MAIAPINITRVSQGMRTITLLNSLRRNTVDIFNQQTRLATGRSFNSLSDDPVAASQSLKMNRTISRQEQILENLRHADLMMSAADDSLSEVNDLLNQAEAIASQSLGTQSNAAEREANAALVASIREQLMIVGNRQVRDSFIFAGRETKTIPFQSALGGVAYFGDTGSTFSRVSETDQKATNIPGNLLFGSLSTSVGRDADLQPMITADTRLSDLRGANAQGIRKGIIVVTADSGETVRLDVTNADTVGDVVDLIDAATESVGVNASVTIQGNGLVVGAGVSIDDTTNGVTASDLGLTAPALGTGLAEPIDLGVRLTPNTKIESLRNGDGLNLENGIRIRNGQQSAVINLEDADTVQDITNKINSSGLHLIARVNEAGTGIEVITRISGVTMSISDDGGSIASELGIRTMVESTTLDSLNFGRGVETLPGEPDLTITSRNGTSFDVNLDDALTVGDVVTLINKAAENAGVAVTAALAADTNGIAIEDTTGGGDPLTVGRASIQAFAVDDLGLNKSSIDPDEVLLSDDVGAVRAQGVFTALLNLEEALQSDDELAIGEVAERLVKFAADTTRVHGIVGARAEGFRSRVDQTENAVLATRTFLSEIEDLDYTEAVTRFQQAQTALQANLLSGSQLMNLSLLDFVG